MNDVNSRPHFDTSLPLFVRALSTTLDRAILESGLVLRNSSGFLTFISRIPLEKNLTTATIEVAKKAVRQFCVDDMVIISADQPGISSLLARGRPYSEAISIGQDRLNIQVLDQRIVGADWQSAPAPSPRGTAPRYVFASIKGGVGRTTALAVAATDFARQGKKVLIVDLDLEAPGIGAMLLPPAELPKYGLLDAYIERSLSNMDDEFLFDMVAPSPFGRGRGLIDVVPAVGSTAQEYPANVLAKLARAYVESAAPDGSVIGFSEQTRLIVDALANMKQYDAILIDARAGLNESTAAALLGLGAQVFLFGEDTPQTFAGYRYLLAHLARFPRDQDDDWVLRLKMIHAKASPLAERQQAFRDKAHDVFQEFLYQDVSLGEDSSSPALDDLGKDLLTIPEFSLDDPESPHYALPILRDSNYFEFDPLSQPSQLTDALYERTYQALLDKLNPARDFSDLTVA